MDVMNKKSVFIIIAALIIFICHVQYGFAKDPQVGVVLSNNILYFEDIHKAFTRELQVEGIKADIVVQKPAPDRMAWTNAARKFVALEMDADKPYKYHSEVQKKYPPGKMKKTNKKKTNKWNG